MAAGHIEQRIEPHGRRGFTLVELMITVVIMGILVVALMNAMQKSQQKTVVIEQITDAQQSLRVIGELLEQDLRHAGMLVPEATALCGVDSTSGPDILIVSDASAIAPDGTLRDSFFATLQGTPSNVNKGGNSFTVDSLILEPTTPVAAYDNDADGTNDTDFQVGGGIIATDIANPDRGVACGRVTGIAGTTAIRFDILSEDLDGGATNPAQIVVVPARIYQVQGNRLTRNGMLVSSDVEDLQVAYFIDEDGNNAEGPDEYKADGVVVSGSDAFEPDKLPMSMIREVRVNVVVRTRTQEKDNQQGFFQPTENRVAVAGQDGFRRRVYTTVVRLRNVGSRNSSLTGGTL